MPSISTSTSSSFPKPPTYTKVNGVPHIDLDFSTAMNKGSGSIFVTDGAIQTVIDRVTGEPKLRVVGATFTKEIPVDQVRVSGTHVLFDATELPAGKTLNVYMGAGVLLSDGKPYAGMTVPGSASFTTPAAEPPPPPGLSATMEMDGNSLRSGEEITVTVTFSKQVDFNANAISAGNAEIDVHGSEDGKTWFIKLSGNAATNALSNVLRLDMSAVMAVDGSRGAGTLESAPYLVDTLVEAYIDELWIGNDRGPDDADGITNDDRIIVGGTFYGELKADEYIELLINGERIPSSQIMFGPGEKEGERYWFYNGFYGEGGVRFEPGDDNTVQVRIVGPGEHHSATFTRTITLDQDAPDILTAPTSPVDLSQTITITFDEAMYLDYHSEASAIIEVEDADGNVSYIALDWHNLSEDGKTLTLYPGDHDLATGNTYLLRMPEELTDLAGNAYDGPAIVLTTAGAYQDKVPPRLVQVYITSGGGTYGAGDVLEFRVRYSEKVNVSAGAELELYLQGGKVAEYVGLANDGTEMIFSYTLGANDHEWYLDDVGYSSLVGHVHDDSGNVLQYAHIEYDGLSTQDGYGAVVETDTKAAKPGTPQLHADSEASAPGAGTTADTHPRLTGSGAEAGATITLYAGGVKVGGATAGADGHWSAALSSALGAGTHQITASQEDKAGNVSPLSDALSVTIVNSDTAPPQLVQVYITSGGGTYGVGDVLEFRVRYNEKVNVSAGAELKLALPGEKFAEYVGLAADGKEMIFTYTVGTGDHGWILDNVGTSSFLGHVRDDAGNVLQSAHVVYDGLSTQDGYGAVVETDTKADKPGTPQLHADSEASAPGDNTTADVRPRLTGSGAEAGATITLYVGSLEVGSVVADADGHWSAVVGPALETGTYSITVKQQDLKGNVSVRSDALAVTITAPVPALAAPALAEGSDGGAYDDDRITDGYDTTIVGKGPAGATLKLTYDNVDIGDVTVDADGNWQYTFEWLEDGVHTFSVRQGESGPASPALSITVDSGHLRVMDSTGGEHVDPNDDIVIEFDETVYLAEGGDANIVVLVDQNDNRQEIAVGSADFSEGGRKLTISAANHNLAEFTHYRAVLPSTFTDLAGNQLGEYGVYFTTGNAYNPSAKRAIYSGDHYVRGGETITFRIRFNEEVQREGTGDLYLQLSNGKRATYDYISGNEVYFTYLVGESENHASLTITDASMLTGAIADLSGNVLDAAHIEFTGLSDSSGYGTWIEIDSTAPNGLDAPSLDPASNTGSDEDLLTSDSTPTLAGGGAEAGAKIEIYKGTTLLGYGYADGSGNWKATVDGDKALASGIHNLTVRQVDRAGNAGADSSALTVTVDTVLPTALAAPALSNDTGASPLDRITKETQPDLIGSGAKPFADIKILKNGDYVGWGTADENGNYTAHFGAALGEGEHTFAVRQYDRVGNVSPDTSFTITVDNTAPGKPGTPDLAAGSDTGVANNDDITNDTTPTFTGANAESGATIVLFDGSREIGRTTVDSSGNWSLTVLDADKFTTDGTRLITARQVDKAGNVSEASETFNFTLDTAGPTLTTFHNNRDDKLFLLTFDENIIFRSDRVITLLRHDTVRREYFGSDGSDWDIVLDGGLHRLLVLDIGMNGTFNLTVDSEQAIVDVAGNVARIIGTPAWTPDQTV